MEERDSEVQGKHTDEGPQAFKVIYQVNTLLKKCVLFSYYYAFVFMMTT